MQHPTTLYVSDLDGTLLDSTSRISPASADILNRAIDCGALFTVATARTPGTLGMLLRDLHMRLPAIVMTGVTLWQRDGSVYSDTCYLHPDTVGRLRTIYEEASLPYFLYTLRDGKIYVYHHGPLSQVERGFIAERCHSPYKTFLIDADGNSDIPGRVENGLLMFAMRPEEVVYPALGRLQEVEGINLMCYRDATLPDTTMLEVFPGDASKALAIRRLASRVGADRIVVYGDNRNDLSMFEIADLAVAVENAIPEVREKADVVIAHHDCDAVARHIYEDFRQHLPADRRILMEL